MIVAGADAVKLVSAIYKNGAGYLLDILTWHETGMKARDFKDLEAVRSYGRSLKPAFFFSSRRRHTMSLRDWSSDVCSSDLRQPGAVCVEHQLRHLRDLA